LEKDILKWPSGTIGHLGEASRRILLVGGFHRMQAIRKIRSNHGVTDRVDVRIVAGDPEEIKALNLKLNADRQDIKITDYFETVIYLNNVNWSSERIAEFLDKSKSWIEEIIRYAPMINDQMRKKIESGELSWSRAKEIIIKSLKAPAGMENVVLGNNYQSSSIEL
jgi:Asp-tRNA(Asn)/Glu-tRNA(Gln) amidotransferase B subunit